MVFRIQTGILVTLLCTMTFVPVDVPATENEASLAYALDQAQQHVRRDEYRQAERVLLDLINNSLDRDRQLEVSSYVEAHHALSELYLRSGLFDNAIEWAEQLAAVVAAAPANPIDKSAFMDSAYVLRARAMAESGVPEQASKLLRQLLRDRTAANDADPVSQLRLLSAIAEIEVATRNREFGYVVIAARENLQRIRQLADRGLVELEVLQSATRNAVRVEAAAGHTEEALLLVPRLVDDTPLEAESLAELLSFEMHIASLFRRHQAYDDERRVLEDVRLRLHRASEANSTESVSFDRSLWQARTTERMGRCLVAAGKATEGEKMLGEAYQAFARLMDGDQIDEEVKVDNASEVLASIETLARYAPAAGDETLIDEVSIKERLLHWYAANRLEDDPRTHLLRVSLAAILLARGDSAGAEELLETAVHYWLERTPREPVVVVRSLVMLAEAKRGMGSLDEAAQLLEQAGVYCETDHPRLDWLVRLNRGRLSVSLGQLRDARDQFTSLLAEFEQETSSADELTNEVHADCLLNLALLDHMQLRYGDAIERCERAVDTRRQFVGDSDKRLLPYYLASAAAFAAIRDLDELNGRLERCQALLKKNDKSGSAQAVQHLWAMFYFLHDEKTANAEHRRQALDSWSELLKHQRDDRIRFGAARTQHYLAALQFREWSELQRSWHEGGNSAESGTSKIRMAYERRRKEYRDRAEGFATDYGTFQSEKKNYEKRLRDFKAMPAKNDPKRLDAFDRIQKEFEGLKTRQNTLKSVRSKLVQNAEELEQEYASLLATAPAGDDWLTRAHENASDAVTALKELGIHPGLLCAALCNLSQIVHAQSESVGGDDGRRQEAIEHLSGAIETIESMRVLTLSGEVPREEFADRFRLPYELLVEWNVAAENPREALIAAEMLSSREFLLQLGRADIHVRDHVATEEQQLIDDFDVLINKYHSAAAQIATRDGVPSGDDSQDTEAIDIAKLKQDCEQAYSRIWQRSRAVENVLGDQPIRSKIDASIDTALAADDVILQYHIGSRESYAFLLDGLRDEIKVEQLTFPPTLSNELRSQSVTSSSVVNFMETYLGTLGDHEASDGLVGDASRRTELATISEILLPAGLRQDIKTRAPTHLTIIPDGALRRLPFEALVVQAEPVRFLIDDESFPPLAYGPSLLTVNTLRERASRQTSPKLLTLGNPTFAVDSLLQRLSHSEEECRNVAAAFDDALGDGESEQLLGEQATEQRLREALDQTATPISHVHLATHGVVKDGVLSYLALTPPVTTASTNEDGRLELHEIPELHLPACELVVLSACSTAVGTNDAGHTRSLEFTLAGAFLTAGSQRVVASHWPVSDDASSRIISFFHERIARALEQNPREIEYAALLRGAVAEYREKTPEFKNAPFHWAPFTLIGPSLDNAVE